MLFSMAMSWIVMLLLGVFLWTLLDTWTLVGLSVACMAIAGVIFFEMGRWYSAPWDPAWVPHKPCSYFEV